MDRLAPVFRNHAGEDVDPWPFIVVAGLSFLLVFSFGPIYFISFGLTIAQALALSTLVFVALGAAAYQRLVRRLTPEMRAEVPVGDRIRRLVYWAVAVALILGGLSLPFLADLP